ncbi:hypothetical protein AWC27_12445 [Mycobacterium szulgai]|uniref:Uncharacterized protein n=1 Tax=Mycobacterium szulgai TaxID=1787 RepID=A0A1X2DND2_MYCSZ|nr:hypothetical protein AWC27_12445 [Mycobacterium szulgai]
MSFSNSEYICKPRLHQVRHAATGDHAGVVVVSRIQQVCLHRKENARSRSGDTTDNESLHIAAAMSLMSAAEVAVGDDLPEGAAV